MKERKEEKEKEKEKKVLPSFLLRPHFCFLSFSFSFRARSFVFLSRCQLYPW
jgi:hypothetical protein